jgi:hypothetical protein
MTRRPSSSSRWSDGYLDLFDKTLVTGYVSVTDEQAIAAARHLAAEEGILPVSQRVLILPRPGDCLPSRRPGPQSHFSPATAGSST